MSPESRPTEGALASARAPSAFATTHWSVVVRAAEVGTTEGEAALEELCRTYWRPLYGFARRRGLSPADAEDATQGFLADLLARGAVARADASRGRFRTFLLCAFENYQSHERERAQAARRGGGRRVLSLDAIQAAEGCFLHEPASDDTPERLYDRKWAMSLIESALGAVQHEYAALGKGAIFDELKSALWGGRGEPAYAGAASRLAMSEGALRVALHRLRNRFGEQLRAEVAKTVVDSAEIDDEVRHLLAAFGR
jgi:DNA-directed RNA polymerase specialized sigma24 family protein